MDWKNQRAFVVWVGGLAILLNATRAGRAEETLPAISFPEHIKPILESRCYSCHGADRQEAGLRLDLRDQALDGGDSGRVIVGGNSRQSRLVERIRATDPDDRMPPEGKPLTHQQISRLVQWIDEGAEWPAGIDPQPDYVNHWAYQPLVKTRLPKLRDSQWPRNAIDGFILKKLQEESTVPSAEADRATLIRRLFIDLVGLPPSPDAWHRWMEHGDPNWYERLVDELLASPHYGERWGRHWLDLARYADSDGYEKDQPRPHAYQWRDWVIRSLNSDLPFDQFTEQQLAGDLLPGATANVKLATGFHRNTLTNREGGIDKEEDRVKQVVDRVNTVGTVWLGLTVECAQCHTHKYDPLSQREYYQLYAFFNSSDEQDFPLRATRSQLVAFESARQEHASATRQAEEKLATIRREVTARLERLEAEWLVRYPDGVPAPSSDMAIAQFDFDGERNQLIVDAISARPARFLGEEQPAVVDGREGNALLFDGMDNRLEFNPSADQPEHHPFTLAAWCYYEGGVGSVLTKLDETADFRGIDFTVNNGMLEVHIVDKWPVDAIKVTTKGKLESDRWHHVLVRYDGSKKAKGVNVFVDGQPQELTIHFDQLTGTISIDQPFRAGSRRTGTYLKGRLDEIRVFYRAVTDAEVSMLAGDPGLKRFLATASLPIAARTPAQVEQQVTYLVGVREDAVGLQQRLDHLTKNAPRLQHGTGIGLAQRETPRATYVHLRGDFLSKGEEVALKTPRFLHPLRSRGVPPDRLDLARWILDNQNTLTPRVTVNRAWQRFFGRGLVESDRDFGSQGLRPTHPELLDWLAIRFVEDGWSIKALHRLMVQSATYRQSSAARPELTERDPYNTWLARQNRQRVEAEIVRDLALASSGLLDSRIHGPSVFPALPAGVIELAFVDVINRGPWNVSSGGDRYRRGLYTFFQRTSAYPMLALFDAPDSNTSCTRREQSNTPLQALTLWNDPVFVECAVAFARRTAREADGFRSRERLTLRLDERIERQLAYAYILGLGRGPTDDDIADLRQLYHDGLQIYRQDAQLTNALIKVGERPASMLPEEFAALVAVCRTVMNLDAFISRE